ncbi:MAG: bifunctional folylpolyglutamate synthase/dihydrofolate synthase [Candidatus Rokubacteria bacterium]|nr:bifunctional folylpolyglutamate synthase/dihydrofolate synthase [Candidatus Rokubacteria bacterium]
MTYREAVERVLGLRGGELAGMHQGLERIETLLSAIGNPEQSFRIAQIGGTNGKGSVASILAAILTAAGLRTGLYTSPHLLSFRERIRVNGAAIPEDDVADGVEALATLVARLDATMFEAATALALDHFAREGVEVAVLEVGMGGRLDATTVGSPAVEVLSRIDLDHERYLGPSLAAIAADKACIIRSGVALSARQEPEVAEILEDRARAAGVPLLAAGRALRVSVRERSLAGQRLDLGGPGWAFTDARLGLLGVYQPENALLAAAAGHVLGAGEAAVRVGLEAARWPGRFQVIAGSPTIVLDGAHNPAGARALAASLTAYFPDRPITVVIGVSADKNAAGILAPLAPLAARFILTAARNARAARPEVLRAALPPGAPAVEVAVGVGEALARARHHGDVICVAGSLFVIGEALGELGGGADIPCPAPGARC